MTILDEIMVGEEEREGIHVYSEGEIEVRTFPGDTKAHNVWIGDNYFLFQRDCLADFAERKSTEELESSLGNYKKLIPFALKEAGISP